METLYMLVVSFMMQNPQDLDRPLFVYYEPHFKTYQQCHQYANDNNQAIYLTALRKMRDPTLVPESIYCLTKEQVKEMHDYTFGTTTPPKERI